MSTIWSQTFCNTKIKPKLAIVSAICLSSAVIAAQAQTVNAADPADFDVKSLAWFQNNTGYNPSLLDPAYRYTTSTSISNQANSVIRNGLSLVQPSPSTPVSLQLTVQESDFSTTNAYFEGPVRVIDGTWQGTPAQATIATKGSATIEHSTWGPHQNMYARAVGIFGMGLSLRYNYITAREDGVQPTGGLTAPSIIEYNWIKGPDEMLYDNPSMPEGNHQDGIQIWQEGFTTIRRNRIEDWVANSAIMIKSDITPRVQKPNGDPISTDPISNVIIDENYFGPAKYFYLRVQRGSNPSISWQQRPRYVTITNNWFETNEGGKWAIRTAPVDGCGAGAEQVAVFVRTEAERDEGVARQNAYPEVLAYRESKGYAADAVDARTWIVWDNNRFINDESEARPRSDCASSDKGWYDLTAERATYAIADDTPEPGNNNPSVPSVPSTGHHAISASLAPAAPIASGILVTLIAFIIRRQTKK